jgi:hypothetical protein
VATRTKIDKSSARDEKAETLWEIFERTGSIGAYLLYVEHMEVESSKREKSDKVPAR